MKQPAYDVYSKFVFLSLDIRSAKNLRIPGWSVCRKTQADSDEL
jgi:hypothetical protein